MSSGTSALLAAAPLGLLLTLLLGLRWSTARSALAASSATLLIALVAFDLGADDPGRLRTLTGVFAEAGFEALSIGWILWPALGIHYLQQRAGEPGAPTEVLQAAIARATREPTIVVLLVAWFLALFLEGAAGFGSPIALATPLLVSAGVRPVAALSLTLIGHAAGVSFGAIGTPLLALAAVAGADANLLTEATAVYVACLGWMIPVVMVARVRRAHPAALAEGGHRVGHAWAGIAAGLFIAPYLALAWWIGPELPSLAGGFLGGLAFAWLWRRHDRCGPTPTAPPVEVRRLLVATAPYLCLVALVLVTRLVPPVREVSAAPWTWTLYDRFQGTIRILWHPGSLLLASLLLGAMVQRARPRAVVVALAESGRRLGPAWLALVAVLALSRLMVHAGMIEALATATASAAGPVWPLLVPFVGVLGTFVTGSATASNLLFADFQVAAASETGLAVPRALGAQCFGAAAGNMIAPMNVVAGAATVGIAGREGEVLRATIVVCAAYAACGGLLTWLLHHLGR